MDAMTRAEAARLLGVAESAQPKQIQAAYEQELVRYKRIENPMHPVTQDDFTRLAVAKAVMDTPGLNVFVEDKDDIDDMGTGVRFNLKPRAESAPQPKPIAESTHRYMDHTPRMQPASQTVPEMPKHSADNPCSGFVGSAIPLTQYKPIMNNPRDTYSLVAPERMNMDQMMRSDLIYSGLDRISTLDRLVAVLYSLAGATLVGSQVFAAVSDSHVRDVNTVAYPAILVLCLTAMILQDVWGSKKRQVNNIIGNLNSGAHRPGR